MRVWAFLFLFIPVISFSQTDVIFEQAFASLKDNISKVDSLNQICSEIEDDRLVILYELKVKSLATKLNYIKGIAQALNNIGVAYKHQQKGKEALECHLDALKLREKLLEVDQLSGNLDLIASDKRDISASLNNIGNAYDILGEKNHAIEYHLKALMLREELKDTLAMARSLNNIASAYLDLPDYYKTIEFGFKALKLYQALGEKSRNMAEVLNNIGLAYDNLKEFEKALDYYEKALAIQSDLGNMQEIAQLMDNMAIIYHQQGQAVNDVDVKRSKLNSALKYYYKALDILGEDNDKDLSALVYNNIGNTYWELHDFPNALNALNKSLSIYLQLNNKSGIAGALSSLATHYKLQNNYNKSIEYALRAFSIADSIDDPEQIKTAGEILSEGYFQLKKFEKSLYYYKIFMAEKDSLTNVEGAKKLVQEESRLEYEKRERQLKFEQEKKDVLVAAEKRRQQIAIWSVVGGLLLVTVFAGFIFRSLRITSKQKALIEQQKSLVDEKNKNLEEAKALIEEQKHMVEAHQKDIISSITYAKRLQEAILPQLDFVSKHLPDSFVLFKPKDIVAGDFYWMEVIDDTVFIAAADCTGHGVPGAMVSVVCSNALNRTVKELGLRDTGKILDKAAELVMETFEKSGQEVMDGMDISLLAINKSTKQVSWSGANNPLWYIQNDKLIDITADKQPIGKHDNRKPYTTHHVQYFPNTTFYLFTDGYADQFGGPKGKKLKYKLFQEELMAMRTETLSSQQRLLDKIFVDWKGSLDQVDDVCIIGIKI